MADRETEAERERFTEAAISRAVFPPEIPTSMLRGLSDVYTREEIERIASTPEAGLWRWSALGCMLDD